MVALADPVVHVIPDHDRLHGEAGSPHHVNDRVLSDKVTSSKGKEEGRSRIVEEQL